MSEFIKTLQAERARLLPIAEAADLPRLEAEKAAARDALQEHLQAKGQLGGPSAREHELRDAVQRANQAVYDLIQPQERAVARIKEIDRMLTAADDRSCCRKAFMQKMSSVREVRDRLAQLNTVTSDLQGETEALKQKLTDARREHGKADLQARLAGKSAPPPKAIDVINRDIESRNDTLAELQSAKEESESLLAHLTDEAEAVRRQLREAIMRCAEVDYYEALPAFLRVIAPLVVGNSNLAYSSRRGVFEARYTDADIAAAEAALNAETDGTRDAGAVSR